MAIIEGALDKTDPEECFKYPEHVYNFHKNVLDKFEVEVFHHEKGQKYAQNDLTLHF